MRESEILELWHSLPPEKREEVADFARFLLSREKDKLWEAKLADSKPRPRLDVFQPDAKGPFDLQRPDSVSPPATSEAGPFGTVIRSEPPSNGKVMRPFDPGAAPRRLPADSSPDR